LNDLLMNTPALFKGNSAGTCFQHTQKVIKFGCTPSCSICLNSCNAFCPCPHCTCPNIMAIHVTTFQDGILLKTLQAP
jgi:hypothetical protein